MSAQTVTEVLRKAGFVPAVPNCSKRTGTPQSLVQSHVPGVPGVPTGKHEAGNKPTPARPVAGADSALRDMRARLLHLADCALVAPDLVRRIPAADLRTLIELATGDAWLTSYLHGLDTLAELRSGRLPRGYDTEARCTHCGPVWLPAVTVAGVDVADGLPLVHGCPWCFVTLPKGVAMPRPIYQGART